MLNILNIPAEKFPTQHSFLEEVFTRNNDLFRSFFLMGSVNINHKSPVLWNSAKVYLLSQPRNRLFASIIRYFIDFRYLFTIPRIVFNENIHVIQIRDMSFPLFVGLLLRKFLKVKIVYQKSHPHEMQLWDKSMLRAYRLPRLIYVTQMVNKVILHKIMMKRCDAVLPITEYMKEQLNRQYGIPMQKMISVGLGMNVENLRAIDRTQSVSKNNHTIRLLYVGTLAMARNIEEMIRAMGLASAKCIQGEITLSIAGGEPADISRLETFCMKMGMEKMVHFHGKIDRLTVYSLMNDCDIGVSYIPNRKRYIDSCPMKLIEYLAVGIPVIATDCVFIQREIIGETEAGVLASDDMEDFSEKLVHLINHVEQYKQNAQKARRYIYENFNYHDIRYRLSETYGSITNKGGENTW